MKPTQELPGQALPELWTTNELAAWERSKPQTIRKNICLKGHHHGLVPIKWPNGEWRFRTSDALAMLKGGVK